MLIVKLLLYLKTVGYATCEINGDAFPPRSPVHCNDNKSDTFSNQSTPDHNDSSNDNIHSSERGCFGSKNVKKFLIPSYYNKPDVDDICALK